MLTLNDFIQVSPCVWELPCSFRADMRVPLRIFTTKRILESALKDKSIEQGVNTTTLPGALGWVCVMPDVHQGYGFPIGGVAATDLREGVISPGGIGYDINCGVRLLASRIPAESARNEIAALNNLIYQICPSGVGQKSTYQLTEKELDEVLMQGSSWAFKKGFANANDLERTEDRGFLEVTDPHVVSDRARERGRLQLGSLGSGNHFIEIQLVEEIFDSSSAEAMGLIKGCLAVQIHSGSRGLGHQVCTDYVRVLQTAVHKYNIQIPDRELVCAPLQSQEGWDYLQAMRAASNFAFVNRQLLAYGVRKAFEQVFAGKEKEWELSLVYDITHNIGKIEKHTISGRSREVCVHRKGATRAFGPYSPDLPACYQSIGQPVLIPGSMGTGSWVLKGLSSSAQASFASCAHGAGRLLSRAQAKKQTRGDVLKHELALQGIQVRAGSLSGLAEETPQAYKDVDEVIECVTCAGLAERVARLRPLAVIKG